jgi:O-acetyl-ADP-ribose deacetylase (regulator of RNase III)
MAAAMGDLARGAPVADPVGSSEHVTHREKQMKSTIFQLRDIDEEVVQSWKKHFKGIENVSISSGDIFDLKADAIVSPANSFGYMDGGIDLIYITRFGWELQTRLQSHLKEQHDGELPVGQATIVETFDAEIPFLISAPTMRVPMNVSNSLNAYLAFRAAIRAVKQHNVASARQIRRVLCPGLCTAIGRMPPDLAAKQMATAYGVCVLGQTIGPSSHHNLAGRSRASLR